MKRTMALAISLAPLVLNWGCSPINKSKVSEVIANETKTQTFYDPSRVLKIEITAEKWNELRAQEPKGGRCVFGFIGAQYDWFKFDEIKIDGVAMKDLGAKKKSWCNSESKTKPSMNIKFDKFVKSNGEESIKLFGTDALILNNSRQDASYVRQCLSYQIFAKAGIPSPLCNFAHLFVNGEDLGVYINLQPMKKSFIQSKFGNPLGNLYEIGGETFENWALPRLAANLEGWKDDSLSDIKAVIEAIKQDKSSDLTLLSQHVNLEQFINYWAMEVIMAHWDGLTLGTNNSYIYFDGQGAMHVLPWGTDQILNRDGARETLQIYTTNNLAAKVYASPRYREKLAATIKANMTTVWSEEEIKTSIKTMSEQIKPHVLATEQVAFAKDVGRLIKRVDNRRAQIASFIDQLPEPQPEAATAAERYFPRCVPQGFTHEGWAFVYKPAESAFGFMQRAEKNGELEGVPCKVDASSGGPELPACAEACKEDKQKAKVWGFCPKAVGFSCRM